jgi:hypothetical protein
VSANSLARRAVMQTRLERRACMACDGAGGRPCKIPSRVAFQGTRARAWYSGKMRRLPIWDRSRLDNPPEIRLRSPRTDDCRFAGEMKICTAARMGDGGSYALPTSWLRKSESVMARADDPGFASGRLLH